MFSLTFLSCTKSRPSLCRPEVFEIESYTILSYSLLLKARHFQFFRLDHYYINEYHRNRYRKHKKMALIPHQGHCQIVLTVSWSRDLLSKFSQIHL